MAEQRCPSSTAWPSSAPANEAQLQANLGAIGCQLGADHIQQLDDASAVMPPYPYYPYWNGQFTELAPPAVRSSV